jgi:hypothetical protein
MTLSPVPHRLPSQAVLQPDGMNQQSIKHGIDSTDAIHLVSSLSTPTDQPAIFQPKYEEP